MKTSDLKSIDDVAKAAGVSSATVSRVINGSASVGSKTRERVEAALRELNYRPNRSAQALARRREPVLGVVLPTLADPFFMAMADGIERVCVALGARSVVSVSGLNAMAEQEAVDTLVSHGCKAIVLHAKFMAEAQLVELARKYPALVIINRKVNTQEARCVWLDNEQGGALMARQILSRGHRQVAFINSHYNIADAKERRKGIECELAQTGLLLCHYAEAEPTPEGGHGATAELLETGIPFSALLAYNDNMALGAIRALHDAGYSVPKAISVVGFDDSYIASASLPGITTLKYPIAEMAEMAAHLAFAQTGFAAAKTNAHSGCFQPIVISRSSVAVA